ncbi:IS110 family transposase [Sinomicrobium pectinilyticum]|uniref:IS110 family transposase n=1 Tax=Sinomicrobium pectinilyticum TaxID=1084421 RepID=A0A3N0EC49_SINP1|nr:IS110 family transposase [Sinomicrobium pectinilyticum]RNL85398.1 IS110 family transposase [Sinomicrobium pectinilyticum]
MKKTDFRYFIGIDVSKRTLDVAILKEQTTSSFVFDNTVKGIRAFLRLLRNQGIALRDTLICMEHTGVYGRLVLSKLLEKQANICVEMALRIARSMGIQRGKNDKIDAIRIARYAAKNCDELALYQPVPEILEKVKILVKIREKLVHFRADLSKHPNEIKAFAPELGKLAEKNIKKTINCLTKEINRIEAELRALVLSDDKLNTTIGLVTSVTGIGMMTALYLTIFTNFFTRYHNPKQLACYCGVVPFEHTSGSSVEKNSRVHHIANKTLKKQLHMCALVAVRCDPEIKIYFERKAEEGKNKMLLLNNVRNKLVLRVCAVIKRQKPYQKRVA